jgi:hypothetical protein
VRVRVETEHIDSEGRIPGEAVHGFLGTAQSFRPVPGEQQRTREWHTDHTPQSGVTGLVREPGRLPGVVEVVLGTVSEADAGITRVDLPSAAAKLPQDSLFHRLDGREPLRLQLGLRLLEQSLGQRASKLLAGVWS